MNRRKWIWVFGVAVVLLFNGMIVDKELELSGAETVYFKLRPVDPRSLMQGDYMTLDYEVAEEIRRAIDEPDVDADRQGGVAIVRVDERGVAHFERIHQGGELGDDERRVKWRYRDRIYIGSNSFMFQEGHAEAYARAEYAEMKLTDEGAASLVDLRDGELDPIDK